MKIKRYLTFDERFNPQVWLITMLWIMILGAFIASFFSPEEVETRVITGPILIVFVTVYYLITRKQPAFKKFVDAMDRENATTVVEYAKRLGITIDKGNRFSTNKRLTIMIESSVVDNAHPYDIGRLLGSLIHISKFSMTDNREDFAWDIWNNGWSYPHTLSLRYSKLEWFRQVIKGIQDSRHPEIGEDLIKGLHEYMANRQTDREQAARERERQRKINEGLRAFEPKKKADGPTTVL